MAKFQVLLALSLLALAFAATAFAADSTFLIEGKVYCDNCRAGFETTISEYIEGANVKLECRNITTGEILHVVEGATTDASGTYKIEVVDDHEEEICEVVLVSSPKKDCAEIKDGRDRARVLVTDNSGLSSNVRYANSLGFLRGLPLEICGDLLAQYNLGDD